MRTIITSLLILITSVSYADVVDSKMQTVFQELSERYVRKYPVRTIKKELAVLDFTENSDNAKKVGIGALYLAYMWPSSSFKVDDSKINEETSKNAYLYYDINPNVIGDGGNIEDTKLQGFMFGMSLNFYF